ncbi:MAG: hypothetical protein N2442_14620 [Spirochaetes bacterium]|nr:hypothetical protein [Spirochaetota bacterium]
MRLRLTFWLLLVLVPLSCSLSGGSSDSTIRFPETRTFNAQTLSGTWQELTADLRYVGTRCLVYVEETESVRIPDSVITEIGETFDTKAYPIVTQYFGEPYDVDGNEKVILLLLDIQDGYTEGSSGYVAGYFDYSHMYSVNTFSRSNQADMIFLDTYPGLRTVTGAIDPEAKEDLKLTLAHEFQHLVNYSEKVIRQRSSPMDTWINEGLSSAAEYLYLGKHVQWKIDYFNQVQYQGQSYTPLNDANLWGQYFVSWGKWGDPLVNYSTVYLFFQWLRIQATNSESAPGTAEIYRSILQDPSTDYRAVETAFSRYTGTTWTWKEIFRTWLFANLLNQPTGRYGYMHQLTDTAGKVRYLYPRFFVSLSSSTNGVYARKSYPPFPVTGDTAGKAYLLPGDAVYVKLSQDKALSESEAIAYGAIDLNSFVPKVGSGSYKTGEILLAGNVKGVYDMYVYSTDTLLNPVGSSTIVGISSFEPPGASVIPKQVPDGAWGVKRKSSRGRPHPMDALLGTQEQEINELLLR